MNHLLVSNSSVFDLQSYNSIIPIDFESRHQRWQRDDLTYLKLPTTHSFPLYPRSGLTFDFWLTEWNGLFPQNDTMLHIFQLSGLLDCYSVELFAAKETGLKISICSATDCSTELISVNNSAATYGHVQISRKSRKVLVVIGNTVKRILLPVCADHRIAPLYLALPFSDLSSNEVSTCSGDEMSWILESCGGRNIHLMPKLRVLRLWEGLLATKGIYNDVVILKAVGTIFVTCASLFVCA